MPVFDEQRIGFKLRHIVSEVERQANTAVTRYDLTFVQGTVLMFLHEKGGSCAQCDIERYLGVSHPAAGGVLRRMEAKKLIRCAFDASDRRVKNIYMTPAGEKLYPQVLAIQLEYDKKLEGSFTPEELETLHRLLDRIGEQINKGKEVSP